MSGALRKRLLRKRQRAGLRVIPVEIQHEWITRCLVALEGEFLAARDIDNDRAISAALQKYLVASLDVRFPGTRPSALGANQFSLVRTGDDDTCD